MLSRQVRCISRLKCWKIIPMDFRACRSCFSFNRVRSWPSTRTVPAVGRSSRFIHRTRADFPAPDRPMMPKISPASTVRLMFSSARTQSPPLPNCLLSPRTSIIGWDMITSSFLVPKTENALDNLCQGRINIRVTTLLRRFLTKTASGSTSILLRDHGRTRRRLPIACAAPRPSSAGSSVPLFSCRGSLLRIGGLTLLFHAFGVHFGTEYSAKSPARQ